MTDTPPSEPTIIEDTREQNPWVFANDVRVVRQALKAGDYSVLGYETELAIERKSLDDLLSTLSWGRERFETELEKLAKMRRACIIAEGSIDDVIIGQARSRITAASLLGSIAAIHARYGIPTIWAGSRSTAAAYALRWLTKSAAFIDAERLGGPAPAEKKSRTRRTKSAPARTDEPQSAGSES